MTSCSPDPLPCPSPCPPVAGTDSGCEPRGSGCFWSAAASQSAGPSAAQQSVISASSSGLGTAQQGLTDVCSSACLQCRGRAGACSRAPGSASSRTDQCPQHHLVQCRRADNQSLQQRLMQCGNARSQSLPQCGKARHQHLQQGLLHCRGLQPAPAATPDAVREGP